MRSEAAGTVTPYVLISGEWFGVVLRNELGGRGILRNELGRFVVWGGFGGLATRCRLATCPTMGLELVEERSFGGWYFAKKRGK